MFDAPVVVAPKALVPTPTLLDAVVFASKQFKPTATFDDPVIVQAVRAE